MLRSLTTTKGKGIEIMLPKKRKPTHAGEILLEEFLKPMEISQAQLAKELGISTNRVNEIVKGKRGITPDTALLLSNRFKMSPEFWLNAQMACDLWDAIQAHKGDPRYKIPKVAM